MTATAFHKDSRMLLHSQQTVSLDVFINSQEQNPAVPLFKGCQKTREQTDLKCNAPNNNKKIEMFKMKIDSLKKKKKTLQKNTTKFISLYVYIYNNILMLRNQHVNRDF